MYTKPYVFVIDEINRGNISKIFGELITLIEDTKWKSLFNNEAKNYGISQADMYQMYAYSKKYQTSEIWLIYPVNQEMRNHRPIQFDSGDGTKVNVVLIDLANIEADMINLKEELSK